jgi:hypothetical protein
VAGCEPNGRTRCDRASRASFGSSGGVGSGGGTPQGVRPHLNLENPPARRRFPGACTRLWLADALSGPQASRRSREACALFFGLPSSLVIGVQARVAVAIMANGFSGPCISGGDVAGDAEAFEVVGKGRALVVDRQSTARRPGPRRCRARSACRPSRYLRRSSSNLHGRLQRAWKLNRSTSTRSCMSRMRNRRSKRRSCRMVRRPHTCRRVIQPTTRADQ